MQLIHCSYVAVMRHVQPMTWHNVRVVIKEEHARGCLSTNR